MRLRKHSRAFPPSGCYIWWSKCTLTPTQRRVPPLISATGPFLRPPRHKSREVGERYALFVQFSVAFANKIARNGMGYDGQGRALQGTRRTRGLNEICAGVRTMRRLDGEQHVVRSRSGLGHPISAPALSNAEFRPGSDPRLASREPSTLGTMRPSSPHAGGAPNFRIEPDNACSIHQTFGDDRARHRY
jgi:hypothetical protein